MIDQHSPTWLAIKQWAEQQLANREARLKIIGLSIEETEGLRYAIRELESLLSLPNPDKMPQFPPSLDP